MTTNTWGSIAADVAKAAPLLGNLIPGLGTVAGVAIGGVASIISSALGVPADPDSVATALANDPDAYVKLKQAEMDNAVALGNLALQKDVQAAAAVTAQYTAEANDRASARNLAASQPKDYTRQVITYMMTLAVVAIVVFVFGGWAKDVLVNNTSSLMVGTLIGYIFSEIKQIYAFWFGSTADSSKQNASVTASALTPGTLTVGNPAPDASQTVTVQSTPAVNVTNNAPADPSLYKGS